MSKARIARLSAPVLAFGVVVLVLLACGSDSPMEFYRTNENAQAIIEALEHYHADNDTYPASLEGLVPAHLQELPEAVTTRGMGWLYTAAEDEYALGYWYDPYKDWTSVCLYTSTNDEWKCGRCHIYEPDCWGPFTPVPTPTVATSPTLELGGD